MTINYSTKRFGTTLLWTTFACSLLASSVLAGPSKLKKNFRDKTVTLDTYLRYAMLKHADPSKLPAAYRTDPPDKRDTTMLFLMATRSWDTLSPATKTLYKPLMARPSGVGGLALTYTSGNFTVHYTNAGADAPDPTDSGGVGGVPDYIERVASDYNTYHTQFVTTMGYDAPPTDGGDTDGDNADNKFDIYIYDVSAEYGAGIFGYAMPLYPSTYDGADSTSCYMALMHDLTSAEMAETVAHEYHHAIQFGMAYWADSWFCESTATWIESYVIATDVYAFGQMQDFFSDTSTSLDSGPEGGYPENIWNQFLEEKYGATTLRSIWQRLPTDTNSASWGVFPSTSVVLAGAGTSLSNTFSEFGRWNLDTSNYTRTNGSTIPTLTMHKTINSYGASQTSFNGTLDHMATYYTQLNSNGNSTLYLGVQAADNATFSAYAMRLTGGTYATTQLSLNGNNDGTGSISGFDTATAVYLVLTNSSTTSAYDNQAFSIYYSTVAPITLSSGSGGSSTPPPASTAIAGSGGGGGGGGGGCFISSLAR